MMSGESEQHKFENTAATLPIDSEDVDLEDTLDSEEVSQPPQNLPATVAIDDNEPVESSSPQEAVPVELAATLQIDDAPEADAEPMDEDEQSEQNAEDVTVEAVSVPKRGR